MPAKSRSKDPVFVTKDDLSRANSRAQRPKGIPAPGVPQKLRGLLVNPARKTRIPRRRVPESELDKDEALVSLITNHERALAQIEAQSTFFEPLEEDASIKASRARVYELTRQAQELKDRRRTELFDLQMAAAEQRQFRKTHIPPANDHIL